MKNEKRNVILLLDDDESLLRGLTAVLESPDRLIIACRDLASAEVILETIPVSCVVSDIRLSSPFAFEGLDLIKHAIRFAPDTPLILMTGDATSGLRLEALKRGAIELLIKPFDIAQLEQLMNDIVPVGLDFSADQSIDIPLLDEILTDPRLVPQFQPIVAMNGGMTLFGFEALARYRAGWPFSNPELLFSYGGRKQRIVDLEIAALTASLHYGAELAREHRLFINIHPLVATEGARLVEAVLRESTRNRIPLDHLVLEITEQAEFQPTEGALGMLRSLQEMGVKFALDDLGIAHSHLAHLDAIRPRYMKISQVFGTGFEEDAIKHKLVRNFHLLARDFSAELILEGVETARTLDVAQDLGIRMFQGYHIGRPGEAAQAANFLQ